MLPRTSTGPNPQWAWSSCHTRWWSVAKLINIITVVVIIIIIIIVFLIYIHIYDDQLAHIDTANEIEKGKKKKKLSPHSNRHLMHSAPTLISTIGGSWVSGDEICIRCARIMCKWKIDEMVTTDVCNVELWSLHAVCIIHMLCGQTRLSKVWS